MKILHINSNFILTSLHKNMIEHLKDDADNLVFVPTYDKKRGIVELTEYAIVSECFRKWNRYLFYYKQSRIIRSAEKLIDFSDVDCIHAYTLFTDGNTAMSLAKKYNKPYVVAVRNTDVNTFFKKRFFLRSRGVKILKNAMALFFLTPIYRDYVIDRFIPASLKDDILKKCYIIPNGLDDFWLRNIYKRNGLETEKRIKSTKVLRCLYVGDIDANKNIATTLKSLSELNNSGWRCFLLAIGRVKDSKVFQRLKKYSFFSYVSFKNKEELLQYYRDADVFIMPSHNETFGLVYAEAMTQGLPVIYTKGQGFDGQFDDGIIGYAVDDKDYHDLTEKILKVIDNYENITERCVLKVNKFDWNIITKQYIDIYTDVLHFD